ncbi:MAG: flagellar hook-associated protein FlgK, partial [Gammaproteobacteria bacterium]|nr:flagellar hook-associated protein FlgK [Gammaproteobacteria bacterium]
AAFGGVTFRITGVPQAGDSFTIDNNVGGAGDNRNALALAGLQDQTLLAGGTATYETAYGQLVADVGLKTHSADIHRGAQQALFNQVVSQRESVSGVNLDEEAANMMRYQQAYQAAAQMISAANTTFQTLLDAVRR